MTKELTAAPIANIFPAGRGGKRRHHPRDSLTCLRVDFLVSILTGHYSLDSLIQWGGYILLVAIVFAETGLLIGCFSPR